MKTKECYEKHTKCNKDYCEREGNKETQRTPTLKEVKEYFLTGQSKPGVLEYIINAVNSHEALIEAVESLLSIATGELEDNTAIQDLYRRESEIIDNARKAIAQMEGK